MRQGDYFNQPIITASSYLKIDELIRALNGIGGIINMGYNNNNINNNHHHHQDYNGYIPEAFKSTVKFVLA